METVHLEGKKILIVEDDYSSRLYLNTILQKSGAEIINAGNGKEAYDIVMNNDAIDLILMDLQLPLMDGFTSTKMIRDTGRNIIIIAQTAYGMTGDRERIMSSGFDDYLIKPISRNQLLDKLSVFLQ